MSLQQRLAWKVHKKKSHKWTSALTSCPHLQGVVARARILTPRKPNSAKRAVAKAYLSNRKRVTAYIPGQGHNLRRYSRILISGGGATDLPGSGYTCVRGAYDLIGVEHKIRRRSIYGVKTPVDEENPKQKRRKFRKAL